MEHDTSKTTDMPKVRRSRKWVPAAIIGTVALVLLCFGAGIAGSYVAGILRDENPITQLSNNGRDGNQEVSPGEENIAAVADKVSPSVVSILTKSVSSSSFYGPVEQAGAGTGIIVSKDGYVLTNKHVVDGANTVTVVGANGETYNDVKVVGRDPLNDIAFLKIDNVSNLKAAELGDSKTVRIGQQVVAIGNALGQYQNTVTSGIVSGTGRSVTASLDGTENGASEELSDLIQTDAAINPGNSGGPLVNMAGQVVGINTAIASDASNVGFVIPISSTKGVIKSVLTTGKLQRAYIGIRYLTITPEVASTYDLPVKQGAYVSNQGSSSPIAKGSPADNAGIRNKDIVTKVNGVDVGTKGSVSTLVGEYQPGDTIELTIIRDGKTKTLKVTLTAYAS